MKMIRGHLKVLVLKALEEGEKTGYGLMKYVEDKIGSKPSSGSMYPILENLKEEGLVKVKEERNRKLYSLTTAGKRQAIEMGKQRDEIINRFMEGFKMMQAITGDDTSSCEAVIGHLRKGEVPLKELNPELFTFRELMIRLYAERDKKKYKEMKRIIKEATQKMRRMT